MCCVLSSYFVRSVAAVLFVFFVSTGVCVCVQLNVCLSFLHSFLSTTPFALNRSLFCFSLPFSLFLFLLQGWTHPKYGANFRCVDPLIHLKQLGAPIVFVDSWKRLPQILDSYSVKKLEEMQKAAIQWYKEFKLHYRYHIMELVYERFVGSL